MVTNNEAANDNEKKDLLNYDKSIFDHEFSGWSVWIELEETPCLKNQMEHLRQTCGGEVCGLASFVPHVTLLYNIERLESVNPQKLLEECLNQYQSNQARQKPNEAVNREELGADGMSQPTLIPTNWYYLHYPKCADNGNGFGCSISLLLIQAWWWLEELQQACQEVMGPDERRNFVPHLSMVYAPEEREDFLQSYTRQQQNDKAFLNQPLRATYLSLWSTQGRIQDWYRITKIPLTNV